MEKLKELKKKLCDELAHYDTVNLSLSSLDTIDKLAHAIKNIDKIIKADSEGLGYSNEGGWSSRSYSPRRYSYADTVESFKRLIDSAPDEQTRVELSRMMQKFE